MPNSVRTAGFILLALLAYFVFRGITADRAQDEAAAAELSRTETAPTIQEAVVKRVSLMPREVTFSLKGTTEPDREVIVRSETMGTVNQASIQEGQPVKRGAILCGLGVESRSARIAEAEASVAAARIEYNAATQLQEKGWTTSNRAAAAKASLDAAEAGLAAAKIELGKTRITAPFDGVFEGRLAEQGDFLNMGSPCGRLVDLDPIIVAVDATEAQVSKLIPDGEVAVELSTGVSATGNVRFVARTANPQTRTFRVEVALPNPDAAIAAGLTATVRLNAGEAAGVLLTPASLVLGDDGRLGVRYVDIDNIVQFAEVEIIDDAANGVWVTGVPDGVNLLVAGQDYLREGTEVSPRAAEGL